jgi:hypothetical protein
MFISSILRPRTIVAVALALIMGSAAYGFAAANTISATNAGAGASTVSGYTVSAVTYLLETSDPTMLDKVTFTLTPDASGAVPTTVKVQLVSGGTWYDATHGTGNVWSYDPAAGAMTVTSVDALNIVAHD